MYYSHLITIQQLVATYNQQQPLPLFLKSFFKVNKKYGSRDRKTITHHIYNYYRLGNALPKLEFRERLAVATYLTDNDNINLSESVPNQFINSPDIDERISAIKKLFPEFTLESIFPFADELSHVVDTIAFIKSILSRPKVFIRIRKGFEEKVKSDFTKSGFVFEELNENTFSFEQEIKITESKSFENGWFEIQDLSSQQTGDFFEGKENEHWWDCCAGAGGKSLLFKDKFPETNLLISDERENILKNAVERLKKAGAKNFEIKTIDLSTIANQEQIAFPQKRDRLFLAMRLNHETKTSNRFDGIIVDAPCSGSGTWARTPENISFFKKEMIDEFQSKQISIVENVIGFSKPGGQLIYITCSAFKKENEDVTQHLLKAGNLKLVKEKLFEGYRQSADTMYAALFIKSN
ncbi:MAG: RsmB/NOP family class I SAM-dependent RNA methyltransferase [Bacteroidia bacterium]